MGAKAPIETNDLIAFLESLTDLFRADRPRPATPQECIAAHGRRGSVKVM